MITVEFDPMIAKVIVHAPTRREAAARLARILETTQIQGLTTNKDFLITTLRHPSFLAGDTTTDFIERVSPPRLKKVTALQLSEASIAIAVESQATNHAQAKVLSTIRSGWRNTILPFEIMAFESQGQHFQVEYRSLRDGRFRFRTSLSAEEYLVTLYECGAGLVDIDISGKRVHYRIEKQNLQWYVHGDHGDLNIEELPRYPTGRADKQTGGLTAPMPGAVLATEVNSGDNVKEGDLLLILEAMKMEHRITAPIDGAVTQLHVTAGDQVENGQLLVTLQKKDD
jgi:propionyl-CoA carboxylase alpha chain